MRVLQLEQPLLYDGLQLSTAFVDEHAGDAADAGPGADAGDVMILFRGGADVPREHLVDLEDAEAGAVIYSRDMAHVIVEHRGLALPEAVWRQRVLVRLAAQWIASRSGVAIEVRGNDLYVGAGKLSVSVATRSPRGALMHFAVNIEIEDAPVTAAGLRDLRIRPREFLAAVARLYADELLSVAHAAGKVRPVP
jgi:hypothetical protein